ncbi:MAG: NAD(P)-dependent alcohol dehydrogenase [Neisseriaceae bacterium]|nr:NAD(P)-dependent alcohol dehydrogenase [Neisseriaceae bacterium]
MHTQAAVLFKHQNAFSIQNIEVKPPGPDEVLIRIVASGVCHTDMVARDAEGLVPLPAILGHEGSGVIEAIGLEVADMQVGDHVVLSFVACDHCENCLIGHPSVCHDFNDLNFGGYLSDHTSPYRLNGQTLSVFFGQSSFSQYVTTKARNAVVVDKSVDLTLLGPLGCGIQTGAGTVLNRLRPKVGEAIVIYGAGAVGLSAIMAAKISGCHPIIAVDRHVDRLALALSLGATHVINTDCSEGGSEAKAICMGGAQYAIETTGVPALVKQALASIRPLGTVAIVGFTNEVTLNIQQELMGEGKSLIGVIEGDSIPRLFIPKLVGLFKQGVFPIDRLVKFYPLEKINEAFTDSMTGAVVKPIIRMHAQA